ncbi:Translocation protein S66 [Conglomerata obtusa]
MIPILVICSSLLIITITFLKNRDKKPVLLFFPPNPELCRYYTLKSEMVSFLVLQKTLLLAAITLEKRIRELNAEKNILRPLHADRIISHEMWSMVKNSEEDMDYEKKEIMAEAQEIKEGWQDKIFEEAVSVVHKNHKEDKIKDLKGQDDTLFMRKKEVLTKELRKRFDNRGL